MTAFLSACCLVGWVIQMFVKRNELENEADVEMKFIVPLLTTPQPEGLGYSLLDFKPKHDIRKFTIYKGKNEKLYYPDFLVLIAGVPVFIIEAKAPGEDLSEALREARLYAYELNATCPPNVNPCTRVIVTDGWNTLTSPIDSQTPDVELQLEECNSSSPKFDNFVSLLSRSRAQKVADEILQLVRPNKFFRAVSKVGGRRTLEENINSNSFGLEIAINFRHVFAPTDRVDRKHIVRNAYVGSKMKRHYVDEIDRIIHTAITSSVPRSRAIKDPKNPREVINTLRRGRSLENEVLLLVGASGAGKSTFVDYCKEVQLPPDILLATEWAHLDVNVGSTSKEYLERYLLEQTITCLKENHPHEDFDDSLDTIFAPELSRVRKALKDLSPESEAYQKRISDEKLRIINDPLTFCKGLSRYLCGEKGKLLVVVFDNSDKGNRADQLRSLEAARWLQGQIRCLIILPIRDTTYDTFNGRPPLDTMIKDLVFRIEPPPFTSILRQRLRLVTEELIRNSPGEFLELKLDNSIPFQYPKSELGYYLSSLFRSLYEHDQMIRGIILGLAGKDTRKAMEIFLDFCRSGHVGMAQIQKVRAMKGNYPLPYHVVSRVLLRGDRRFYDGDKSHVKNLFQCEPGDSLPDSFIRVEILDWLRSKRHVKGPSGIKGYFQCRALIADLVSLGHDRSRIETELNYLIAAGCIIIEHQEGKIESLDDLIVLSPAGFQHLRLIGDITYLAACSEDTWVDDERLADRVSSRIGRRSFREHFSIPTSVANATEFVKYLAERQDRSKRTDGFLDCHYMGMDLEPDKIISKAERILKAHLRAEGWEDFENRFSIGSTYKGTVINTKRAGVLVKLENGPVGLIPTNSIPEGCKLTRRQEVDVVIQKALPERQRLYLKLC